MLIAIFSFTLLCTFIIYKILSKERYTTIEKPLWKKLIYWAVILFISIIFSMVIVSNNASTYKLTSYFNRDTLELVISIILPCLIVQLISPSVVLYKKIYRKIKKIFLRRTTDRKVRREETTTDEGVSDKEISYLYAKEKNSSQLSYSKESQEKDFELFLNTVCWLSFSFVILINVFFMIIAWVNSYNGVDTSLRNLLANYDVVVKQLNDICCILLILTIAISVRQIIFYLNRLRNHSEVSNNNIQHNSIQYDKYLLVRKKLSESHKKL
jgi:hypothetical protein